jgi:hypothetical protein
MVINSIKILYLNLFRFRSIYNSIFKNSAFPLKAYLPLTEKWIMQFLFRYTNDLLRKSGYIIKLVFYNFIATVFYKRKTKLKRSITKEFNSLLTG